MNDNEELKNKIKFKIAISEIEDELTIKNNYNNFKSKLVGIAACMLIITVTGGIVFAKDIQEYIINKFKL